jgi:hypothetical protein
MIRVLLVFALAVTLAGCTKSSSTPVPLDQVPESLMKISHEKLPDVTFDRAVIKPNGIYEISGKDKKGKVRDVEMTAAGEVTEVE